MTGTGWQPNDVIDRIRPTLYRYLQGSAFPVGGRVDTTSDGTGDTLGGESWRRLAAVNLSVRPESEELLQIMSDAIDRLPRVRRHQFEETPSLVRGPVVWSRTHARRVAAGDPTLFVTRPRTATTFSPHAHLLAETLEWYLGLEQAAAVHGSGHLQRGIADLHLRARHLRASPKLPPAGAQRRLPERVISAVSAKRSDLHPVVAFRNTYRDTIHRRDVGSCQRLVDGQLFRPDDDDRLYELLVGHELAIGAENAGYQIDGDQALIERASVPFVSLEGPAGKLRIWWQRSYWSLEPSRRPHGVWARLLSQNNLAVSGNVPDFVVELVDQRDWLLVEAKWTADLQRSRDRDGLRDVLAYLKDADAMSRHQSFPRALVVAVNSTALPNIEAEVALMSEELLSTAFCEMLLNRAAVAVA